MIRLIFLTNSMFNHAGAYVAISLLNKFPPDYLIDLLSQVIENCAWRTILK